MRTSVRMNSERAAQLVGVETSVMVNWADARATRIFMRHIEVVMALQADPRYIRPKQEGRLESSKRETKQALLCPPMLSLLKGPGASVAAMSSGWRVVFGFVCAVAVGVL